MTIEVQNLSFQYNHRAVLKDLNFKLAAGRFNALLGPNGAGKSTLFGLLTRLLAVQRGDILLAGHSLKKQPDKVMRKIGVVFQQNALDLDLTVRQNLQYHASLHGLSRKEAEARGERELERFSLHDRANDAVRELNGGHRRRLEIARALLHEPSLLLLDEPTVGLDLASRKALNKHVRHLCEQDGLTVLWTTHLIEEVAEEDYVMILHEGKILAHGVGNTLCESFGGEDLATSFQILTGAG